MIWDGEFRGWEKLGDWRGGGDRGEGIEEGQKRGLEREYFGSIGRLRGDVGEIREGCCRISGRSRNRKL